MKRKAIITFIFLVAAVTLSAQMVEPVKWSYSVRELSADTYDLVFTATIEKNWHLYSQHIPENGPIPTKFSFNSSADFELVGNVVEETKAIEKFDESFGFKLKMFENIAVFKQSVKLISSNSFTITGTLEFMSCDDKQCTPPMELDFKFRIPQREASVPAIAATAHPESVPAKAIIPSGEIMAANRSQAAQTTVPAPDEPKKSLWAVFWIAFLGGFAAILTPCVFPMIPMTVSYFTKQSKSRAKGIRNGIYYGLSIIIIYVILGTVVTAVFGADSLNKLSTDPWFNLFFALLLGVFAVSFFGAFEIVLPSSWVNAADRKSEGRGLIGIFFMAFTLALVSFSCTGPIVGALIVQAASIGGMAPVIGMLGFSLALALPFAFFAAFPGYLNSLPKSGGWLNSVKVVLAFLELAFALKFLSIADMVLDLKILTREVFIASWIVIFGGLGFYLLGKIRLPHDSKMEHLPVGRFLLGLITLIFVIYMIPGLWGAPVNLISGFPPPTNYAESPFGVGRFSSGENQRADEGSTSGILEPEMHFGPQGIPAFDDYDHAMVYAKRVGKPLLIDFTGKGCTNCRKMEDMVWSNQKVKEMLTNDFILVSLYVDFRDPLPESEQYTSPVTGRKIKTIGNKWSDFQITRFKRNSQPHYVILDNEGNDLVESTAYNPDVQEYTNWLERGLKAYQNK